ncbi:ICP32 [Psittacid alphaherpesvirus 1]|uniref:Triplex capsid protein 1 n=1 Tax=Psittacid herpesvirus 1 (isolate Amazon parrot/-/97-0001/1997) TaxID=670426 RepID=TRX1_PSHV1|nr:capsid triplex subunit 1 [Psittacid alphaherpesvirus 1]Q6UDJ3.1 RecName: Full=Triplex capsid protein 1 [Psittacid herpesvirus 1 Amazon parrot/1997]AAQ73717.1 ICP32 [Psittacid alphaherpesvirus 1]
MANMKPNLTDLFRLRERADEGAARRENDRLLGLGSTVPQLLRPVWSGAPTVTGNIIGAIVNRGSAGTELLRTGPATNSGGGRMAAQQHAFGADDAAGVKAALLGSIAPTADALRAQQVLTTQVTVTDMCKPDVEGPGSLMLFFRGVRRLLIKLSAETMVRNDLINELETAFMILNRICGLPPVGTNGINNFEASLVSLNVLAAAAAPHYRNTCEVDALRTFVLAGGKDSKLNEKLTNLDLILQASVESRNFPHSILFPAGALTESVNSTNVACVKMLMNGSVELEGGLTRPCGSFRFPACLFLDLDDTRQCGVVPRGADRADGLFYVYLLFLYSTETWHPSYEIYVAKSALGEAGLQSMLDEKFARRRVNNTVAAAPPAGNFYARGRQREDGDWRCYIEDAYRRASGNNAVNPLEQGARPTDLHISFAGVPDRNSATYAAFCQLGVSLGPWSSACRYTTVQRHGLGLKYVELPGLSLKIGTWRACY